MAFWTRKKPKQCIEDYFPVDDIVCVDAEGNPFEQYERIYVAEDVVRNADKDIIYFTPDNAVRHFETQDNGTFLPSNALQLNILAKIFRQAVKKEADGSYTTLNHIAKQILDQYKDKGNGTGWHGTDTIIGYEKQQIIDYPSTVIRRKTRYFCKENLHDCSLEEAFRDADHFHFLKQLTGLADLSVLIAIGNYFDRSGRLWFPWSGRSGARYNRNHSAWFGCNNTNLNLNANYDLSDTNAARGVCLEVPAGHRAEKGRLSLIPDTLEGALSTPITGGDLSTVDNDQGNISLAEHVNKVREIVSPRLKSRGLNRDDF